MNLNFPHREAVVVRDHELRVTRRFPSEGQIKVRSGERVAADSLLGKTDPTAAAVRVPVADQLAVAPKEVARCLLRPVGSTFSAGEPLARTRRGLRNAVIAAPAAGVLTEVDNDTGIVTLVPANAGEIHALVPGDVEYLDGRQAVVIRTVGSRVLGIVGLGEQARGPLKIAVDAADQELQVGRITTAMKGAVVVGGAFASAAAMAKLVEFGAVALVTGGLLDKEVASFLGWQAEDRLAAWRPQPGDRTIGEGSPTPLVLMATEGFGPLPMNGAAFGLLTGLAGQQAVVLGGTRVTDPLIRPELIVADEALLDDDAQSSHAAIVRDAQVRLVDQANLGLAGTIQGEPRRERLGDGCLVDVVEVALAKGRTEMVPIANVEVVS